MLYAIAYAITGFIFAIYYFNRPIKKCPNSFGWSTILITCWLPILMFYLLAKIIGKVRS